MLLVSECVAKAALERTESRGGHTRDDHPSMDAEWRKTLLVCRAEGDDRSSPTSPSPTRTRSRCATTCSSSFEIEELEKYFTAEELANHPARRS